jgi:uncharacterized protein (TIGR01777 family)
MTTPVSRSRETNAPSARRIAVTGSSGLIGSALVRALEARGDTALHVVRRDARRANEISWNPQGGVLEGTKLNAVDAVVNLAGENLAQRWSESTKRRIYDSRVKSTALLARTLASLDDRPSVLLSGSAVGIYGDRGDELLDESSASGRGFLADVCRAWEGATSIASDAGIRVVHLRTGLVLAGNGGILQKMLIPFRLGVGGKLGSGRQWMSWIALDDHVRAMLFLLDASLSGAVNVTAPEPATNAEFTNVLAHVLGRPSFLSVPRVALELAMGEMARETALVSQRAIPERLLEAGFAFQQPSLEGALRSVLTRSTH